MNRSGVLTIILLCGALAGCVTSVRPPVTVAGTPVPAPHSDAYLLPTLMGSLAFIDAECATQVVERPGSASELRDILLRVAADMRAAGWPFMGGVNPCGPAALHCIDSKCPSKGFGDVICKSAFSPNISIDAAMKILEMETLLRFAHEPSPRMFEHLDRKLRTTYDEVRARRR